jgi:hypothetical protein
MWRGLDTGFLYHWEIIFKTPEWSIPLDIKKRISGALSETAEEFEGALDDIDPTRGNYPERMVSYYYIQALVRALKTTSVLLELPVTGKRNNRADNHIDALVFNDREMIVAEFKVGWAPSHWESLARDLQRIQGPAGQEIGRKFLKKRHRKSWIFLGADCWYQHIAESWKSGEPIKRRALPPALGKACYRDYVRVWDLKGKDYDGYYLTWALFPFDQMAS